MAAKKQAPKDHLCFVIGPIGKDGSVERKHADLLLNAIIKLVLGAEEFGYRVKRADEDADPGMIADRVITDIIHAEMVVADLTDLNPNAFYELGIRHSIELSTIHIAKEGTILPFDNVTHRTIFVDLTDWHSQEKARTRLAEAVRATKKEGYKVSNPITQANASFKMRQSEDPRDQVVAELKERVAALEIRSRIQKSAFSRTPNDGWSNNLKEVFFAHVIAKNTPYSKISDELHDWARIAPGGTELHTTIIEGAPSLIIIHGNSTEVRAVVGGEPLDMFFHGTDLDTAMTHAAASIASYKTAAQIERTDR
jgi:hypothetical protein